MNPILRLVNRNLTVSLNPGFLIWQVVFPLMYIFVWWAMRIRESYPAYPYRARASTTRQYLATGMIGFNINEQHAGIGPHNME